LLKSCATPLLHPPALADVVREDQCGVAALELDAAGGDLDVDHGAVLDPVLPGARDRRAGTLVLDARQQLFDVLGRADVGDRHREELVAAVAVVAHGGVVDGEEAQRLRVVDPHRERMLLEQEPVALLTRVRLGHCS
jgi:hypothetical protein